MGFRAMAIDPAEGFSTTRFVVRPLLPSDAELDHAAVMASRDFLFHWEQDPPYPPADFSVTDNLADLEQMRAAHLDGTRYTFTVMSPDETETLGCLYFLSNNDRMYASAQVTSHDGSDFTSVDGTVLFWIRVDRWSDGLEAEVLAATLSWIDDTWSIERPAVVTNEKLEHQIATIESLGLTRRFDYDRERDMYRSYVYA